MDLKNTKRRIMALCMSGLLLCLCACTGSGETEGSDPDKEKSAAVSAESDQNTEEESESDDDVGSRLVMKTFGEMWLGTAYYIDVNMHVEYSADAVEGDEDSENESGTVTKDYNYIIAVDAPGNRAGLNMISDSGYLSCVIKDSRMYTLNHKDETYESEPYPDDVVEFGEKYTTKISLGIINQLTFQNTGKTDYSGQQAIFETYKLEPSEENGGENPFGETYITYYFDENETPIAEVMQTEAGITTFTFKRISRSIVSEDIFEIPEGYKEVKE